MLRPSPRLAACGLALLAAAALAADLLWMPVQVGDSLGELLDAQASPSAQASWTRALGTTAYLRPLRIAQIKVLFDLAQGRHYWLVYRGFHALLLIATVLLFIRAMRVSTAIDFAAAAFALVVLIGLNTFRGAVREAFPINHFLEMMVLCLVTLNLARSTNRLGIDVAAAATLAAAALTLESGLLVWVVAAAAWAAGWRGISARGLVLMTAVALGYAYLRFMYLSTGVPALSERSAGYLLEILDPPALQQRFGSQPLWFYGYNVLAAIGSTLFSEPRDGVFETVSSWLRGRPMLRVGLPLLTSFVTTGLLLWVTLRRVLRSQPFDDTARMIVVFLAVLLGNAAMSFAYAQDEIMSVAGVFYALATYGVMREALKAGGVMRGPAAIVCALLLCTLATGWSRPGGWRALPASLAGRQAPARLGGAASETPPPGHLARGSVAAAADSAASARRADPRVSQRADRLPGMADVSVARLTRAELFVVLVSVPPVAAIVGWLVVSPSPASPGDTRSGASRPATSLKPRPSTTRSPSSDVSRPEKIRIAPPRFVSAPPKNEASASHRSRRRRQSAMPAWCNCCSTWAHRPTPPSGAGCGAAPKTLRAAGSPVRPPPGRGGGLCWPLRRPGRHRPALAAAAALFVAALAWRFVTFTGFSDDHYAHLALAQQWLLGDRPVRDFSDPGWPLTYTLSAIAWRLAGDTLAVEWTLIAAGFAAAAACTVMAAQRLSGSDLDRGARHRHRNPHLSAHLRLPEGAGVRGGCVGDAGAGITPCRRAASSS